MTVPASAAAGKPRFLFVIQHHISRVTGGTEMQAWMLAAELARRGWDVHYASEMNDVPVPAVLESVTLHGLPENPDYWRGNREPLRRLMERLRPDVIYTRVFSRYLGYAVMDAPPGAFTVWSTAARYDGYAWPYLAYGLRGTRGLSFFRRLPVHLYHNHLARFGRKHAHLILAQQSEQQRDLARLGIPSEILRNSHLPVPENNLQRHESPPVVLWVDTVKQWKRPEVFIELARRCQDVSAEFLMIGRIEHDHYKKLLAAAARDLSNFRYGGFVPPAQVPEVFRRAHLHVKTSQPLEGFPNTFVEAWLHGVPVVSLETDPEGFLNEQHLGACLPSVDAMEQTIRHLLSHPDRRREIGLRARQFAEREFDLKNNVDRFERLLAARGMRLPNKDK